MSYNGIDRKDRAPSPSEGSIGSPRNVVDHDAPHGQYGSYHSGVP